MPRRVENLRHLGWQPYQVQSFQSCLGGSAGGCTISPRRLDLTKPGEPWKVTLYRSRWKGVTPEERSRQMRAVRAGKKKRP